MKESEDNEWVFGAPRHELERSTAAQRVAQLAARSELFLSHYEYRSALTLPEWWCPEGRPDLGEPAAWNAGVLPESKYQGFRHDRLIGSFHPSHRAKWSSHELCHGLVGFAWRPDASLFFSSLAARLAEALPVALWYFFDEADCRRCDKHAGQGALRGPTCLACEALGREGAQRRDDTEAWWSKGRAWLNAELEAIRASIREGQPLTNPHPTIDLCSDGLAYAAAQYPRLSDPVFARYVELFFREGEGYFSSLEALEARVIEVADYMCGEGAAKPWSGDRWRWVAQDIGMRLVTVWCESEGEVERELEALVLALAESPREEQVADTILSYRALHSEWVLPDPEELFGVGYPLPEDAGLSYPQAHLGLESSSPRTLDTLGLGASRALEAFVRSEKPERWQRRPIGRRFADYLAKKGEPLLGDLARFEAAVIYPAASDTIGVALGMSAPRGEELRCATGLEVLRVSHAVTEEPPERLEQEVNWVIWRGADGDVRLLAISDAAADLIEGAAGGVFEADGQHLEAQEVALLCEHGVFVPMRWALDVLPEAGL